MDYPVNALLESRHSPLAFVVGPFETIQQVEDFAADTSHLLPEAQTEAEMAGALPMVDFTAIPLPEPREESP